MRQLGLKSSEKQTPTESGMLEGKSVMHREVVSYEGEMCEPQSQWSGLLCIGRPAKHN